MLTVRTWGTRTVALSLSLTGWPSGALAATVAVLSTWPASMSAWVRTWLAVQLAVSPGSSVAAAGGQVTVTDGSLTTTPVRVTLPVFSRAKV